MKSWCRQWTRTDESALEKLGGAKKRGLRHGTGSKKGRLRHGSEQKKGFYRGTCLYWTYLRVPLPREHCRLRARCPLSFLSKFQMLMDFKNSYGHTHYDGLQKCIWAYTLWRANVVSKGTNFIKTHPPRCQRCHFCHSLVHLWTCDAKMLLYVGVPYLTSFYKDATWKFILYKIPKNPSNERIFHGNGQYSWSKMVNPLNMQRMPLGPKVCKFSMLFWPSW